MFADDGFLRQVLALPYRVILKLIKMGGLIENAIEYGAKALINQDLSMALWPRARK